MSSAIEYKTLNLKTSSQTLRLNVEQGREQSLNDLNQILHKTALDIIEIIYFAKHEHTCIRGLFCTKSRKCIINTIGHMSYQLEQEKMNKINDFRFIIML